MPLRAPIIITSSLVYAALMLAIHLIANTLFPWCTYSSRYFNFSQELRDSIDADVDPCDNFYGHVCGRWTTIHPTERNQLRFLQSRTLLWLLETLEKTVPSPPSTAVDKVIAGYQKCLAVFQNGVEHAEAIRKLFERFSYEWPSLQLSSNFDFMDFMVGLALDYGIHVLIQLDTRPYLETDVGYSLYVTGVDNITDADFGGQGDMAICIQSFSPKSKVDVTKVIELLKLTHRNLEVLSHSTLLATFAVKDLSYPKYIRLQDFAYNREPSLSLANWVRVINKHLPTANHVDYDAPILAISDFPRRLLVQLAWSYKNKMEELVLYLGWKVINYLAHTFSSDCTRVTSSYSDAFQTAFKCIFTINSLAPYAVSHVLYQGLVTPEASSYSKAIDNNLRKETQRSFQRLSWMDGLTRAGATDRMAKITGVHGSPSHLPNMTALNMYYDYLPSFEKPFVEDLFGAFSGKSNKRKQFIGSDPQRIISREDLEQSMIEVNALYAPVFHSIFVNMALLQSPFIELGLPDVVNYGSLGRVIGHELSHAFGPERYNYGYRGGQFQWYSLAWNLEFHKRLLCLISQIDGVAKSKTLGVNTLEESFADAAGMERAILAYQILPKGPMFLGYTQDQLFFVVGCFAFCSADAYTVRPTGRYPPAALRCNLPAMNLREFGLAFKCPQGAPMNPLRRCTFLS